MDHPMDPVRGPLHGPPLISNRKSPLLILKFTGGQGINKNTNSYLLLASLRVCLVIVGCFGIALHKWEDQKLVLRYRRSSAFLSPPPNIFRESENVFSFRIERGVTLEGWVAGYNPLQPLRAPSSKMAAALKRSKDQVSIYCSYPQRTPVMQAMCSRKTLLY